MARLDMASTNLVIRNSARPTIDVSGGATGTTTCSCNGGITADGSVDLVGTPGESVAGWTLGYIQMMFVNTDYTRYRGDRDADGSVKVTQNTQQLCRDTDESTPDLWYDPVSWGIHGGRGTRVLPAGTVIPAAGKLTMVSNYFDAPGDSCDNSVVNSLTGRRNLIHKVHWAFAFCCILTAKEPLNRYHFLKHFYWNVRWEANFTRNAAGVPAVRLPADLLELNVQHRIHSGSPNDSRFRGREIDPRLPVANNVAARAARVHPARDWSQI